MRIAVVLFNLGGPENLDSVGPFLKNLFSDPAIINLPKFLRLPLASLIAKKREQEAKYIYASIGGGSPLRVNTEMQADALEAALNASHPRTPAPSHPHFKCFVAMRYAAPTSDITAAKVTAWQPDKIVFLPLYPHFSATTTASSFRAFEEALGARKSETLTHYICCYPALDGFIAAQVSLIAPIYQQMLNECKNQGISKAPRLLFSAHGLPEKTIHGGDPYQFQCELTARKIAERLNIPNLDWRNSYQSRVGPLKWIGPYTDAEIIRAGTENVPLLIAPIAFVSEHSETLYELDQLYRKLATEKGVPLFARTPAVGTHPAFIDGLAGLVRNALAPSAPALAPDGGTRICPVSFKNCLCRV